jgi:hypothetical protein
MWCPPAKWLRTWSSFLNQKVPDDQRRRLKEAAAAQEKVMVKVTVSKKTGKKQVTGP